MVDLGFRKNEAIFSRVVGLSFLLMQFDEVEAAVEVLLFLGSAGFLEGAELGDGPLELAGEALGVEAQVGEGL